VAPISYEWWFEDTANMTGHIEEIMALFFKEKSEGDWKLNSIMKRQIDINELE